MVKLRGITRYFENLEETMNKKIAKCISVLAVAVAPLAYSTAASATPTADIFGSCVNMGSGLCLSETFSVQNGHKRVVLPNGKPFTMKHGYCFLVHVQGEFTGMSESLGVNASGALPDTSAGEWWIGAGSKGGLPVVANGRCVWVK